MRRRSLPSNRRTCTSTWRSVRSREGYTLAYTTPGGVDNVRFDLYKFSSGIVCMEDRICRDDEVAFVKVTASRTDNDLLAIRQTYIISKDESRVVVRMEVTNCRDREPVDLRDFIVKRYADIDVDTGGTAGWAGLSARRDKHRDSVFTYDTDEHAAEAGGRRAHVVNVLDTPSDLLLNDTFVGQLGSNEFQFQFRDNPDPLARCRQAVSMASAFCSGAQVVYLPGRPCGSPCTTKRSAPSADEATPWPRVVISIIGAAR
jgi:hypothetical protein